MSINFIIISNQKILKSTVVRKKLKLSHRTLRKKINYDLLKQQRKEVNWVDNLSEYAKCPSNYLVKGEALKGITDESQAN